MQLTKEMLTLQVAGSQTLKESGKPVKVAESDVDVSTSLKASESVGCFKNRPLFHFLTDKFMFSSLLVCLFARILKHNMFKDHTSLFLTSQHQQRSLLSSTDVVKIQPCVYLVDFRRLF